MFHVSFPGLGLEFDINRVAFYFYLEKLTTSKEFVCTVRVNNHCIMARELSNILNALGNLSLQESREIVKKSFNIKEASI
mgnify:CR=1 FL=1